MGVALASVCGGRGRGRVGGYSGSINQALAHQRRRHELPLAAWQWSMVRSTLGGKGVRRRRLGYSCCHCCRRRRCLIFCFRCLRRCCCMFRFASSSFCCLCALLSLFAHCARVFSSFFLLFICRKSFKCVSSSSSSRLNGAGGRSGQGAGAPRQRAEEDTQQFQQQ